MVRTLSVSRTEDIALRFRLASTLGLFTTTVIVSAACGDDGAVTPQKDDAGPDVATLDSGLPEPTQPTTFTRPSHGSRIDVSEDDKVLVAANLELGTVTVFHVAYPGGGAPPTVTKKAEVETCAEPTQLALTPNGERAFVVCRKDQKVVRLDGLRGTPVKGPEAKVGSEPTGIALTPNASRAYVPNWVDGTVSEIDTNAMTVTGTIDLNAALVATGALGSVTARPALAHPRSVAITNNNDPIEDDESLFVTEYFAQQKETLATNGSNADIARSGLVYRVNLKDKSVRTLKLPPIADIGFKDHAGGTAGCFPNQLTSINVQGAFAYVVSICASPRGPLGEFTGPAKPNCSANGDADCPGAAAGSCDTSGPTPTCKTSCSTDAQCGVGGKCENFDCQLNLQNAKTVQTPAVSVIDIGSDAVVASVPLNSEFDKAFIAAGVPDTTERRYPLHVWDIAFVPGTLIAYMPARGADAVYRVEFNATYESKALDSAGSPGRPFIALDPGSVDATQQGKLPVAVTIAHRSTVDAADRFAFVLNESTRNVTVLDLAKDDIAGLPGRAVVAAAAPQPADAAEKARLEGKRLFATGVGRWSRNGQAWLSCETCHVDGLSDQVTWFHLRGPRQTPSLDQTFSKSDPSLVRMHQWTAHADEIADHEAGALRITSGGVGSIVKTTAVELSARIDFAANGHGGLNGSARAAADPEASSTLVKEVSVLDDWKKITSFMQTIRTPNKPSNLDAAKVTEGHAVFEEAKCQGCHGGPLWTISKVFYNPDPDTASPTNLNRALRTLSWTNAVTNAGFPTKLLPTTDGALQTMRYNSTVSGTKPAAVDSITCLLRQVGTFNTAEPGVGVAELRRDHTSVAQGGGDGGISGFNVPSLLGVAVGAPFFHAGQARTLEALLADPFAQHHAALADGFLASTDSGAAAKRAALVQFLLAIDQNTNAVLVPALGPSGGNFCATP